MKIPFENISNTLVSFEITSDQLEFIGNLKKANFKMVECKARIFGKLHHCCDICGDAMLLNLDEMVDIFLNDGIYKDKDNKLSDVIEFYDGQIDIEELFLSEIESYKSDYFYCEKCKKLKGE